MYLSAFGWKCNFKLTFKTTSQGAQVSTLFQQRNRNKTQNIYTRTAQQKTPTPSRTINLRNSERSLNQNKIRRSRDRIKGSINHKIKPPLKAVYSAERKKLTYLLWALLVAGPAQGCISNLSTIRVISGRNVIYCLIKISIITHGFRIP